jgi:hypothetical protein
MEPARKVSRCGGPDGVGAAMPAGAVAWANQATHAARWRHVVWPRSSLQRNKRTGAAGRAPLAAAMATGALTRRAAGVPRIQQSAERAALKTADCLLFGGWFCVLKTLGGVFIAQAHDVATGGGSPQRASRASTRRSAAAARTNIGEYKRSSVWLCCTLLPLCISARRAGAKRSLYRGRRPPPRYDTAAARW